MLASVHGQNHMSSSVDVSDFISNGGSVRYTTYDMMIPYMYQPVTKQQDVNYLRTPDEIHVYQVGIDDHNHMNIGSNTSPDYTDNNILTAFKWWKP